MCIRTGYIYKDQMPAHVFFLAWQAHYDLKDPAGLAGFLIDSDIKLVRAESGSPDGSSQHSGSRRHEKKWDAQNEEKTKFPTIVDKGFFFVCFFCFFTPRVGMVWSIVGLHSWV